MISKDNNKLNLVVISIDEIIDDLNEDYKIELENNGIKFTITSELKDKYINVDYVKIKRVFANIISNSVRYLDESGEIMVNITSDGEYIKFTISDNGPGVSEDKLAKIFDPFFTTDYSRKISGLGLSICKEFVEIHNGKINAYNNNGLTITISLPEYEATM